MGSSVLLHSKVPQGPGRRQRTGPQRLRAAGVPSQRPVLRGPDGAGLQRHPEAGLRPGGRLPLPLLAHLHPDWRKRHHRHGEAHPVSVHRERAAQTHQDMKKREGFKFWRSVPGGQGVRGGVIEFLQSFWEQLPSLVETKILFFFFKGWFRKKRTNVTILERFPLFDHFWSQWKTVQLWGKSTLVPSDCSRREDTIPFLSSCLEPKSAFQKYEYILLP